MAKVYVCDACGMIMSNPYEAKMREFYVGMEIDYGHAFPCNVRTRRQRVHLCDECYHSLHELAMRKSED